MKVEADPEEILLLSQLRDGSLTAFNRIYTTYAPQLYKRLLRLLKDPEVVEEVLQDVFLKVWDKRGEIIPDRGFRTFIFRMSEDRKSTRLNSSHVKISYAVFCLKK